MAEYFPADGAAASRAAFQCLLHRRAIQDPLPRQHAFQQVLAHEWEVALNDLLEETQGTVLPLTSQNRCRDHIGKRASSQATTASAVEVNIDGDCRAGLEN